MAQQADCPPFATTYPVCMNGTVSDYLVPFEDSAASLAWVWLEWHLVERPYPSWHNTPGATRVFASRCGKREGGGKCSGAHAERVQPGGRQTRMETGWSLACFPTCTYIYTHHIYVYRIIHPALPCIMLYLKNIYNKNARFQHLP